MQTLTGFAVTTAALGAAMAVADALLPSGTLRGTARTATGLCYLAALAELAVRLLQTGG